MANPTVVLLSAGSSKERMPGFPAFNSNPAFLPINSRSIGKIIIDFYLKQHIETIYLVVNQHDLETAQQEFGFFGSKLKIITVINSTSVIDTVEKSLNQILDEDLIINIITSIPNILLKQTTSIGVNKDLSPIEGWSGITYDDPQKIEFISKLDSIKNQYGHSFSGIFRSSKSDILNAIQKLSETQKKDLIQIIKIISQSKNVHVELCDWLECGHTQNYFQTRTKIFGSRHFNSLQLNVKSGVIQKSSTEINKLKLETEYLDKLPSKLKVYFPRVIEFEENETQAKVKLEYYSYPTLAESMLYWSLPLSSWKQIFNNLAYVLNEFSNYKKTCNYNDWKDIYLTKTETRVQQFFSQYESQSELTHLFHQENIKINGQSFSNWNLIKYKIESVYQHIFNLQDSTIIHGDFCFNNILCDPYVGLIKLLDARGSFGDNHPGIYGDKKYDWAKLSHSVLGRYDYIVNDLFSIEFNDKEIEYKTYDRPWQSQLDSIFMQILKENKISLVINKFIMGTLFVSMTPLHRDSLKRQMTFYAQGIKYLNESIEEITQNAKL